MNRFTRNILLITALAAAADWSLDLITLSTNTWLMVTPHIGLSLGVIAVIGGAAAILIYARLKWNYNYRGTRITRRVK